MKGIEFNKIIASLLIPGIASLFITNLVDILYKPDDVKVDYVATNQVQSGPQMLTEEQDIYTLLVTANFEKGKLISKKCSSCHTFEKDAPSRIAPNLWNIVGAKKAHLPSFNYSKAMLSQPGIWDEKQLMEYLKAPQKFVPGTKMSFAGISKNTEIADLIAYMKSMSDNAASNKK